MHPLALPLPEVPAHCCASTAVPTAIPTAARPLLAQVTPATFAPFIQPLADQVAALWAAGQLREGERVLLWEGG